MNKIYPFILAFLMLLAAETAKSQHFAPEISAFDNYMTITCYVVIDGEETDNDNYEIGCFIDGQCRGSYRVTTAGYLGHAYTCFLSVWGSSADNGKAVTIKIYDQTEDKEYEANEKTTYQYNGELGTLVPYQLTVFTDPSMALYYVAIGALENGSVSADKTSANAGTTIVLTATPGAGYETATISAAKTNESGTNVALSGTGTTRTFIMPAHGVTVTAIFQKTADQQAVEAAKALIEAANFAPMQTDATDETTLKTWLTAQIYALQGMAATGITVTESDITISDFLGAIAGTASDIDGTNGSFRFTVSLVKGGSSVSTVLKNRIINATDYVPPVTYSVSVAQTTNGTVTPDVTSAAVSGETVILTITPSDGFELNAIKAYKTSATGTEVMLGGSGNTRTFVMPSFPVTISATFKRTQATLDAEAVTTAKELIENEQFSFNQVDGNSEVAIKQQLADKINGLPGMSGTGITVSANDITINEFSVAVAGTSGHPNGTNGSFSFTIGLEKGASSKTTASKNASVTATKYVVPTAYSIEIAAITNGSVTPDVTSSVSGETVTLTITPSDGFELNAIKAYKTGTIGTEVTLSGMGVTRTFTMPAYPVTISATFKRTQATLDAEAVTTAKELIENEQFSFNQVDGNSEVAIKQQLADKINGLPGMSGTGITVSANDITINEFSAAVAGTSGHPNGTNGSFSFIVDLEKGASSKTTVGQTVVINATPYNVPVTYSIIVSGTTDGTITSSATYSVSGETIILIIIPSDGFKLNSIKAYKTGATGTEVMLGGSGNTRTFVMPSFPVTVLATFKKTQATLDAGAVTTAKELVENEQFSFNQVDGNSEVAIKQQLADKINGLPGMSGTGITVSANNIAINEFSAAVAGTSGNLNGTNGSFSFTVNLEKGDSVATTSPQSGYVLATVYISVTTVTLNLTTTTIVEGESEMLIATVSPGNATNPDIVWTSSDESVATVDASGLVTGVLRGTATITATTIDGLAASCRVTVDWLTAIGEVAEGTVKIYPNPVADQLTIAFPDPSKGGETGSVVISDMYGRVIVNHKLSNGQSVDVSHLSPGVYVVTVETGYEERLQQKIVKN